MAKISYSNPDFGSDVQQLFLSFMISDPVSFALSQNIIKAEYFDDKLRAAARFILEYAEQYKKLPTPEQILAISKVKVEFYEAAASQGKWYLDQIEKFCRYRALESVVLGGIDLLEKGEGGQLEKLVKDALTISLLKDLGSSYFHDPETRLERLKDKSNFMSTGWKALDDKLYGGFTRGSLNIFAGGSGSGKSIFLQNIARNWAMSGLNVVYITLELSEDLTNLRLDSMITGFGTKEVLRNTHNAALTICTLAKTNKVGTLMVKKLPEAGTTCNTIRAYLKEYEIQEGKKPDGLIIDYLDLMYPNNDRIDVSNLFVKDKNVSEEMRAIGTEWDIPVVSASQLNRSSVEAQEFDHSHIAGGISKINTADNVFGIFTSQSMRERGVYQLQFLKTRSSSAVGDKIELAYDPTSMAISDPIDRSDDEKIAVRSTADLAASLAAEIKAGPKPEIVLQTIEDGVQRGMSITQMAHPEHKTYEQLKHERPPQAQPLLDDIHSLMARTRGKE